MNWTGQIAPLDPPYQYRYILGVDWDLRPGMDQSFIDEFLE